MKRKIKYCNKILIILVMVTIFMSIGYASVNSITMDISGEASFKKPSGVYITDVTYEASDNSSVVINYADQTIVNSLISLDSSNCNSSVKLKITVHNVGDEDYLFVGSFFDKEFYDNENITFDLLDVKIDDNISKDEYKTFYVVFKYKDTNSCDGSSSLSSIIDYRFEPYSIRETLSGIEFNYQLKNSTYAPEGDVYEYYSVDANRAIDNTIKIIVFGKKEDYSSEVSSLTEEPIDLYQTGSISMYRKKLSDGMYKVYILSETGKFILNENAAWMFDKLYSLEEIINLHLLDTSKVTNMRDMFCDCAALKRLDLSNFDTSNVVNMIGMFARMTVIDYLDLSTFDTSKVTEIGQMFTTDSNLKKIYVSDKWDISQNVASEDGAGMFTHCSNLTGGNGTKYDVNKITYTMAVIDGKNPGYLTNGYNMDTGINVNHVIKNKSASEIENWTLESRYSDTSVKTLTFGMMGDYTKVVSGYDGVAVDSDGSGVISVFRIPNGSMYDVYILSNSGLFEANSDSSWLFDGLVMLEKFNNLNMLDTSKVTNMRDMFCDLQTITSIDLSNFNTTNSTTFEGMFARNYNVKVYDLSSFSTNKITTIKNMFVMGYDAVGTHEIYKNAIPKVTTIYVSNKWNITGLEEYNVFTNNVNLVGGNGTVFNSSKITTKYAVADTNSQEGYFTLK